MREDAAVIADQVEARHDDCDEDGSEEEIELALDAVVDFCVAISGAFFGFVFVLLEARDRRTECGLSGLQRVADLLRCGGFGAILREGEHAVDGIPELREGLIEIATLVAGRRGDGEEGFLLQGINEVGADAFELRNPRHDGVRLGRVLHVAHGEAEGVEIVLYAQELQGVAAVAVNEFALHLAHARKLHRDLGGIGQDSEDSDDQAEIKAASGRLLRRRSFVHWGQGYNAGWRGTNFDLRKDFGLMFAAACENVSLRGESP